MEGFYDPGMGPYPPRVSLALQTLHVADNGGCPELGFLHHAKRYRPRSRGVSFLSPHDPLDLQRYGRFSDPGVETHLPPMRWVRDFAPRDNYRRAPGTLRARGTPRPMTWQNN